MSTKGYGTESDENTLYTANVIANTEIEINGQKVDASKITPEFLSGTLQEAGDIEANVATGYHAIEFLLWGQDLNGTGPGAGERPVHRLRPRQLHRRQLRPPRRNICSRRATCWSPTSRRWSPTGRTTAPPARAWSTAIRRPAISTILTGMGSLSYGELAGERMKLGLLLHDPEEEHDCFSDNTYISHLYDAIGIRNVYQGSYTRVDGTVGRRTVGLRHGQGGRSGDRHGTVGQARRRPSPRWRRSRRAPLAARPMTSRSARAMPKAMPPCRRRSTRWSTRPSRSSAPSAALKLDAIAFEGSDSLDAPDKVFQ